MISRKRISVKWNYVGIRRQKIRTRINSKWPCSTTFIRKMFLFAHNFKMTFEASGKFQDAEKNQYLRTLFRGEVLRQFDMLYADFKSITPLTLEAIFGIGYVRFPVNALSKKKRAMRHGMRKPYVLKLRCYMACLIDLNKYLPSFPGSTPTHKIGMTELNGILLKSMPNSWIKQAYVQGFY